MALQLVITNAGRAAVIDQEDGGFRAVRIAAVGVSPTAIAAAATATTLPGEVKRIVSIAGEATATDVVHLTVTDESDASYAVRSFALYLSDGTLFALYGQADTIVEKSAHALLLLSIDVALAAIPAAAITFGNANFTNPAATTDRAGVVELATDAEVATGKDNARVLSAGAASRAYAGLAGATFVGTVVVAPPGSGQVVLAASGNNTNTGYIEFRRHNGTREGYIGFAPSTGPVQFVSENAAGFNVAGGPLTRGGNGVWDAGNDGAGSGLDADLLDGRQATEFALLSGATFVDNVVVAPPGAGQVTLSQGTASASGYVAFARAGGFREGYFGFAPTGGPIQMVSENGRGYNVSGGPLTRGGNGVWDAGNDGAGSGLDADLLDGRQATEFALLSGATFVDNVVVAPPGAGQVTLSQGTASASGYVAFARAGGFREGYFGFAPTGGPIQMVSENGRGYNVSGGPLTRGGNGIWDAGNDGAGSGLDADLLDGRQATEFALLSGATYTGNVVVAPVGFGQVTLATSGNNTNTGYVEFRSASGTREGFIGFAPAGGAVALVSESGAGFEVRGGPLSVETPNKGTTGGLRLLGNATSGAAYFQILDPAGVAQWGYFGFGPDGAINWNAQKVWHAGNDGAGSGLDADLLGGWQRDDVRDWNNLLNRPGAFPPAAHAHAAADIAGAFPASMSGNGYTILPNGLILQWMNVGAGTTEGSFPIAWPLAFPNACLCVCIGAQISTVENDADVDFQLVGEGSTTGATLMRQRNGEWKTSISASARLIVIGF